MGGPERPPEQVIRDWLDEHGSVTVGIAALEQTWKVEQFTPRQRREVQRALERAGVTVQPSLRRVGPKDPLELSVARAPTPAGPRPARLGLIALAIGLMVIGSLGPWAKDIFVTDYGLDRDGALVIAAAGLAALALAMHARRGQPTRLPIVAAALGALALGVLASEFRDTIDDSFVEPAWGLYVAAVGSALLVALSMSLLARRG